MNHLKWYKSVEWKYPLISSYSIAQKSQINWYSKNFALVACFNNNTQCVLNWLCTTTMCMVFDQTSFLQFQNNPQQTAYLNSSSWNIYINYIVNAMILIQRQRRRPPLHRSFEIHIYLYKKYLKFIQFDLLVNSQFIHENRIFWVKYDGLVIFILIKQQWHEFENSTQFFFHRKTFFLFTGTIQL